MNNIIVINMNIILSFCVVVMVMGDRIGSDGWMDPDVWGGSATWFPAWEPNSHQARQTVRFGGKAKLFRLPTT
jgi:hypothetical protein